MFLSSIFVDIYMHFFECTLFNKLSFPFSTRCVHYAFNLIITFVHNIDNIRSILNWIDRNIQFTNGTENNGLRVFLDTFDTFTERYFSTSVYRRKISVSLEHHFHVSSFVLQARIWLIFIPL